MKKKKKITERPGDKANSIIIHIRETQNLVALSPGTLIYTGPGNEDKILQFNLALNGESFAPNYTCMCLWNRVRCCREHATTQSVAGLHNYVSYHRYCHAMVM